jgi:hypothetical protein
VVSAASAVAETLAVAAPAEVGDCNVAQVVNLRLRKLTICATTATFTAKTEVRLSYIKRRIANG